MVDAQDGRLRVRQEIERLRKDNEDIKLRTASAESESIGIEQRLEAKRSKFNQELDLLKSTKLNLTKKCSDTRAEFERVRDAAKKKSPAIGLSRSQSFRAAAANLVAQAASPVAQRAAAQVSTQTLASASAVSPKQAPSRPVGEEATPSQMPSPMPDAPSQGSLSRMLSPSNRLRQGVAKILATRLDEYNVELRKVPQRQIGAKFRFDTCDCHAMFIKEIRPGGLIDEWNRNHGDCQVIPGDAIININGIHDDAAGMRDEMKKTDVLLRMRLRRTGGTEEAEALLSQPSMKRISSSSDLSQSLRRHMSMDFDSSGLWRTPSGAEIMTLPDVSEISEDVTSPSFADVVAACLDVMPPTTVPATAVEDSLTVVSFKIEGLSFAKLSDSIKSSLSGKMQAAFADRANIPPERVAVTLSSGSVAVKAAVPGKAGGKQFTAPSANELIAEVKSISGIDQCVEPGMSLDEIGIPAASLSTEVVDMAESPFSVPAEEDVKPTQDSPDAPAKSIVGFWSSKRGDYSVEMRDRQLLHVEGNRRCALLFSGPNTYVTDIFDDSGTKLGSLRLKYFPETDTVEADFSKVSGDGTLRTTATRKAGAGSVASLSAGPPKEPDIPPPPPAPEAEASAGSVSTQVAFPTRMRDEVEQLATVAPHYDISAAAEATRKEVEELAKSASQGREILVDCSDGKGLGIDFSPDAIGKVVVSTIYVGGLIDRWNGAAPPALELVVGSELLAVNGGAGNTEELRAALTAATGRLTILALTGPSHSIEINAHLKKLFHVYDLDGSGHLNLDEFSSVVTSLALTLGEDLDEDGVEAADEDGSGLLDYDEFLMYSYATFMKCSLDCAVIEKRLQQLIEDADRRNRVLHGEAVPVLEKRPSRVLAALQEAYADEDDEDDEEI